MLRVKVRIDEERRRRLCAVWSYIWKSVVLVALGFGLWRGGEEGWRHFVWENPYFLIKPPAVTTDGNLTREQILAAAGIVEGRNMLTVDLGQARAALENLPQVDRAEVTRTFPSTVALSITERQPVAWVTAKKGDDPMTAARAFLIDARGIVLRSRSSESEAGRLPVISGVETEDLVPGQRANWGEILAALELLRLNADSSRFQIRGIDLAKACRLVVSDQRRGQLTFGVQRIEEQLGRLNQILDLVDPSHREIRTVNLVPERNVPVTFHEPEPELSPVALIPPPPAPISEAKAPKPETIAKPGKAAPRVREKAPVVRTKPAAARVQTKPQPATPTRKPLPAEHLRKPFSLDE